MTNRLIGKVGRLSRLLFVPTDKDVFLISFPRSGNSWLRSAIAEMMFGDSGKSLVDIHNYVPSIGLNIPKWSLKPYEFHVVKSHEIRVCNSRTDHYRKFIYVVRDPRDVVLSHFRFLSELGKWSGTFDRFFDYWANGAIWPGSWLQHVTSWIGGPQGPQCDRCLIVRYEDLCHDIVGTYKSTSEFLGINLNQREMERVIRETSIARMRRKEERSSSRPEGFHSIQTGGTKKWESILSVSQINRLNCRFGEVMKWFDYL